jgi:hypothetical protein
MSNIDKVDPETRRAHLIWYELFLKLYSEFRDRKYNRKNLKKEPEKKLGPRSWM